ncbi:hypothetical protein NHJ13051_001500 [Beauveria bassiana]
MGLQVDTANDLIASSELSPVEKNILTQTSFEVSCDVHVATREILRRVDKYGVPLEEALRGLKHDWYRNSEPLSTRTFRGQQSNISEIVYRLPLSLYAKFCGNGQGEPAALRILEFHAPPVPSPLFVDNIPLAAGGKPWLSMTSVPVRRLNEVVHTMSYPE